MSTFPGDVSDDRLMQAVRAGDTAALATLFQRHHAGVYAYCARTLLDADAAADVTQDVFMRVFRYRASFGGDSRFRAWLFGIARNACRDAASRQALQARADARWLADLPPMQADRTEELALLETMLAALEPPDREVLVLKRLHGLSYAEIASVMGCSQGAARVRVHRALLRLREMHKEARR